MFRPLVYRMVFQATNRVLGNRRNCILLPGLVRVPAGSHLLARVPFGSHNVPGHHFAADMNILGGRTPENAFTFKILCVLGSHLVPLIQIGTSWLSLRPVVG